MASLKEIAAACGVSIATVSKALNNQSDISAATKARVTEKAKELGYVPNYAARVLKTEKTHNIGVLFSDAAHSGLTHDYFSRVLDSFKNTAEAAGYDITFISPVYRETTVLEHARARKFDGIVIACVDFELPYVKELIQSEIPTVTIDYVFNDCMAVLSNNAKGMADLLTYLYDKGHRKIAYIHGDPNAVTRSRLSSFYMTAEKLGLDIPEEYIREAHYRNLDECRARTLELLDLPNPPTCIMYPDDFAAYGGLNAIRERGLSVPEDISIAGYDGIRVTRYLEPKMTTLWQDMRGIGAVAAEKLVALIERPKTTLVEQVTVDGTVFEGNSVKSLV